MRKLSAMAMVIALSFSFGVPAHTQTQCACTGQSSDRHEGGDASPLRWMSLARLVRSTPTSGPEYCYERRVDNQSDRDVTDIYWPVAGVERPWVGAHQPICDATSMPGAYRQPHPTGPLHYNTGPQSYPTTVYAPPFGWPTQMTQLKEGQGAPALASTLQIPIKGVGIATLSFTSSVRTVGNMRVFQYEITNNGPEVRVFWNVPLTQDFRPLEFLPNAPATMVPGGQIMRQVQSSDPLAVAVADVHVYTRELGWLGSGIATAYVSARGVRQIPLPRPARGQAN
jgi:hypothetical protein